MWLLIATLLFQMWEKRLKKEMKGIREGGRKKNDKRKQEKRRLKEINEHRDRGVEVGTERKGDNKELK